MSREYLTVKQIAKQFPGRDGQGVHPKTVWRWILYGCQGRKLRAVKVGQGWCSTPEWVDEFVRVADVCVTSATTAGVETAKRELARRWGIESQGHAGDRHL